MQASSVMLYSPVLKLRLTTTVTRQTVAHFLLENALVLSLMSALRPLGAGCCRHGTVVCTELRAGARERICPITTRGHDTPCAAIICLKLSRESGKETTWLTKRGRPQFFEASETRAMLLFDISHAPYVTTRNKNTNLRSIVYLISKLYYLIVYFIYSFISRF